MFKTYAFASLAWLVLAVSAPLGTALPAPTACGTPGKAPCPLQSLMRDQLARPYALGHFDELKANAAALVALNPDPTDWHNWDVIAREAVQAADAHDGERTLHACTHCHHTYRREYVEKYRERALPTVPAGPH